MTGGSFYGFLLSLLLIPGAFAQEPTAADVRPPSDSPAAKLAQSEELRRSQTVFTANKALESGDLFLQNGDYAKAVERYQFVLQTVPADGPTGPLYSRAAASLAQTKLKQAAVARDAGDFDQAASLLGEAVQYDPTVKPMADKELARLGDARARAERQRRDPESLTNNPVITPEFKDQIAAVQKDLFEGDRYFETGQYSRADESYRKALVIDPYNAAARQKLERLDRYNMRAAEVAHESTRVAALYDIERRWSEREVATPTANSASTEPATESNVARLTNKLAAIKIDSISFVGTPVDDAIRILAEKAKAADPSGQGINFVLKLKPTVSPSATSGGSARGGPATAASSAAASAAAAVAAAGPAPVTLSLNDVSLAEVLRVLTQLSNLKYKVEEYAVYILPSTESSDVLIPRTFVVPPGFFQGGLASATATTSKTNSLGSVGNVDAVKIDVKQQLIDQGVDFPAGSTAAFLSGSSKLVVKNTPDQIDRIDSLLQAAAQEEDPQVEIEAKFTEFTDNQLRELVINWGISLRGGPSAFPGAVATRATTGLSGGSVIPSGNFIGPIGASPSYEGQTALRGDADLQQNSLDGLLQNTLNNNVQTASAANFLVGATIGGKGMTLLASLIDQIKGVDLLSAPKVTTKNRQAAKIEIARQMRYPNQFTAPTYNQNLVGYGVDDSGAINATTLIAPPTPSSFDKASIGVTMDVTPVAYADRRIDLDLKPEVTDFEGFVDYGSTVNVGNLSNTNIAAAEIYHVRQPVFNNRKITTKLQVLDGQTVVLGGLVREDTQVMNDKVPVLGDLPVVGRLFQSKVDQKTKRNLIIFITARIIRSTGKAKYTALEEQATPVITAANAPASFDK